VKLELRDVSKYFGGLKAVDNVHVTIDKPELIGLIGPNGAGKTTLANLIDGVHKPTTGSIWLNGARIDGLPPYLIAQRGLGRTFQVTRAFRRMTVMENMLVPAMAVRPNAEKRDVEEKACKILELLTIEHLRNELGRGLSGGQQKLLELGRLLMLDPDIIILDEPFAGVHPKLMEVIYEYIRRVNERGKAMIIISHQMDSIFALCERLLVLNYGDLIADDTPDNVKNDSVVIEAYLGTTEDRSGTGQGDETEQSQ